MKTIRYRFEQAVQEVNEETTEWLIGEFKSILTSDKDFTRKADYIGFSIASIDSKIASIDEELKELQSLKKKFKLAKDIALRIGAEVFSEYGIDKLEGAGISSVTVTKSTSKSKQTLLIQNEEELIKAGYVKSVLHEESILQGFSDAYEKDFLSQHCSIQNDTVITEPKLKINKRRTSVNQNIQDLKEVS